MNTKKIGGTPRDEWCILETTIWIHAGKVHIWLNKQPTALAWDKKGIRPALCSYIRRPEKGVWLSQTLWSFPPVNGGANPHWPNTSPATDI